MQMANKSTVCAMWIFRDMYNFETFARYALVQHVKRKNNVMKNIQLVRNAENLRAKKKLGQFKEQIMVVLIAK